MSRLKSEVICSVKDFIVEKKHDKKRRTEAGGQSNQKYLARKMFREATVFEPAALYIFFFLSLKHHYYYYYYYYYFSSSSSRRRHVVVVLVHLCLSVLLTASQPKATTNQQLISSYVIADNVGETL